MVCIVRPKSGVADIMRADLSLNAAVQIHTVAVAGNAVQVGDQGLQLLSSGRLVLRKKMR